MGADTTAAGIDEDGKLYVWGIVDGTVIDFPLEIGAGVRWTKVEVSDAILALNENGELYELGLDIPISVEDVLVDSDNDGVPDNRDDFPYDPNHSKDIMQMAFLMGKKKTWVLIQMMMIQIMMDM